MEAHDLLYFTLRPWDFGWLRCWGKFKILEYGSCQILKIPAARSVSGATVGQDSLWKWIHKTQRLKKPSSLPQAPQSQKLWEGYERLKSYNRIVYSSPDLKINLQSRWKNRCLAQHAPSQSCFQGLVRRTRMKLRIGGQAECWVLLLGDRGSVLDPNMCYQLTIFVVIVDGLFLITSQN